MKIPKIKIKPKMLSNITKNCFRFYILALRLISFLRDLTLKKKLPNRTLYRIDISYLILEIFLRRYFILCKNTMKKEF